MKRSSLSVLLRRAWYVLSLAALMLPGCGGGCGLTGGLQPLALPLPKEVVLENGIQVRVTNQGFAFVEENLGDIVRSLVGDHICVPPNQTTTIAGLDFKLCPSNPLEGPGLTCDGAPGCRVDLNIDSINFDLAQASDGAALLNMTLQLDAGVGVAQQASGGCVLEPPINDNCFGNQCSCADGRINMDIDLNPFGSGSTCDLIFGARNFVIDASIALFIKSNRQLGLDLRDLNLVAQLDNSNQFNIDVFEENRGSLGIQCGTVNAAFETAQSSILGFILGFFEDQINGLINDQLQSFLPDPPGVEGRVDIGSLLGDSLPLNLKGTLELSLIAGGYVKTETSLNVLGGSAAQRGLSLGMRTAVNSDITPDQSGDGRSTPNPCVRTLPLPQPGTPSQFVPGERFLERAAEFAQNTIPGTSNPYDVGIGISEAFLDAFGFHLFNSGMLCLQVNSDVIGADLLSSSTLSLLLPSITDLVFTPGGVLPVSMQLRPQTPPDISIGTGAAGDALIQLDLSNLDIDLFTTMDDRLVRLFTANTSLLLGINLDIDAQANAFIPTIDTSQLANLQVNISNSEILAEDPESIAALLPTLIQLALPALTNAIGPIAVPNVSGFTLDLNNTSIQKVSVTLGELGSVDFLGIFAGLAFDPSGVGLLGRIGNPIETKASLVAVQAPEDLTLVSGPSAEIWPSVVLDLAQEGARLGSDVEWQARVDGGAWGPFQKGNQLVLREPVFMLQGEHQVEVRAREAKLPSTTDPTPVKLSVRIDTVAPSVALVSLANGIAVRAQDPGTADKDISLVYRLDGGDWTMVPSSGVIPQAVLADVSLLEVQATDAASHSTIRSLDLTPEPSAAGCAVSPETSGNGTLLCFLAVLGGLLFWRNRRSLAVFALFFVAAFVQGCACGAIPCSVDADCAALSCDDGEIAFCEIAGSGTCQCGVPDPIEAGNVGRFADIAADGDVAVVVAYNQTFGDLVLARVQPKVGEKVNVDEELIFVDGVPAGPVVADPSKLRGGVRAVGDDVGTDASVVVDSLGNAHIAYYDITNQALKYARVDRQNVIETMNVDVTAGVVVRYTDIIIGTDGKPQISYMAITPEGNAQLRFAKSLAATPNSTADWAAPLVVDSTALVAPDPANLIDIPKGLGLFTSMQLRGDGRTRIVYNDSILQDFKRTQNSSADPLNYNDLARQNDPNTIGVTKLDEDANGNDLGSFGLYASLFVDPDDGFHHLMFDTVNGRLVYFGSASGFVLETVDDGIRNEGGTPVTHKIGGDASLVGTTVNGVFTLFAAYHDGSSYDLVVAKRSVDGNGNGTWTPSVVSGNEDVFEGSKGFFATIAISQSDPNVAFVGNFVFNHQSNDATLEVSAVDLSFLP